MLRKKSIEVLREFGLEDLAQIREKNPDRFDQLYFRGLEKVDLFLPPQQRLSSLIASYRQESQRAEEAGAYRAAVVMRGAALEGLLLLRCMRDPLQTEAARLKLEPSHRPSGPASRWGLAQLIKVCDVAGWLPRLHFRDYELNTTAYAGLVRELRNTLHPGRQIAAPDVEIDREELADARAALTLIEAVMESLDEKVHPR